MKIFRATTRFSALLLLVLTVHVVAHGLLLSKHASIPLQEQSVFSASLATDSGGDAETRLGDFKPPKHSFIDYSVFFAPNDLLPAYNPVVSRLLPHEPLQNLPNVYLEINVPPDNLA